MKDTKMHMRTNYLVFKCIFEIINKDCKTECKKFFHNCLISELIYRFIVLLLFYPHTLSLLLLYYLEYFLDQSFIVSILHVDTTLC